MKCPNCNIDMIPLFDVGDGFYCGTCGFTTEGPRSLPKADAYSLLAEVRAELERFVEGEYRIFHSDSMDQNTGLEEDLRNLYKKVSEHFT